MRVLWIVNGIMPQLARAIDVPVTAGGSWLNEPLELLSQNKEIQFSVATMWHRDEFVEKRVGNVNFYILPGNYIDECWKPVGKYKSYCEKIVRKVKPDVFHIFGGEFAFGLGFIPFINCSSVLTVQGFISEINKRYYYGGIKVPSLMGCLLPWNIRTFLPMKLRHYENILRGKSEIKQVGFVDAVIGNTSWDYTHSKLMNPTAKYYYIDYAIRREFFNYSWDINNIERHTILFVNMSVPLKGFHTLLDAVMILKDKYPDIKIKVAGGVTTRENKVSGYANYLKKKIETNELDKYIVDLGVLNGNQMATEMERSHTFTLTSCIENGPNVMLEAMLVGTPSVCSFVGGAMDYAEAEKEALFYRFDEPELLAYHIERIWQDDRLAEKLSKNAKERAKKRQDFEEVSEGIYKVYQQLVNDRKN